MTRRYSSLAGQRGISLVEIGIAIAVLAVLLIAVFLAFQRVLMDRYLTKARQEVPVTVTVIATAAMTQVNTQAMNTQIMSQLNAWPKDRVTDSGQSTVVVAGPFPGSTEKVFGYANTNGTRIRQAWSAFNYWISDIPEEACLPLLQLLIAQRSVVNLMAGPMSLNRKPGTTTTAGTSWLASTANNGAISLNMGAAATACSADSGSNKQINVLIARE